VTPPHGCLHWGYLSRDARAGSVGGAGTDYCPEREDLSLDQLALRGGRSVITPRIYLRTDWLDPDRRREDDGAGTLLIRPFVPEELIAPDA